MLKQIIILIFAISYLVYSQYNIIEYDKISDNATLAFTQNYELDKLIIKLNENSYNSISTENIIQLNNRFNIPVLDEVIVKYGIKEIRHLYPIAGISPRGPKRRELARMFEITFIKPVNVKRIINELSKNKAIEYAEPRFIHQLHATPNDAMYDSLFALKQIKADLAWDIHKGENNSVPVLIGISDSGVEWYHPDLAHNVYNNLGEDADGDGKVIEFVGGSWRIDPGDINGIDNDGNGKIDDFIGWNFYTNDNTVANNPYANANNQHGTHVAGIAAGRTNNSIGISSVSWNIKFLPVKHGSNTGGSTVYNTNDGLVYLADIGVDIINCSWGSYDYSELGNEIIEYCLEQDIVVFASAGNGNSENFIYPASYKGVVSVASLNKNDEKAYYSEFGKNIDISTPGGDSEDDVMIKSSVPPSTYANFQGTSMASPLAAGAFALLKSYRNTWSNSDLLKHFLSTADNINSLNPNYTSKLGYGRVNIYDALNDNFQDLTKSLKLYLENYDFVDENNNNILEPNENVEINVKISNRNPFYGSTNLAYTFSSTSNQIAIINPTGTIEIGSDGEIASIMNVNFDILNVQNVDDFIIKLTFTNPDGIEIGNSFDLTYSTVNHIFAWGRNNYGQMGDGTNQGKPIPTKSISEDEWLMISVNEQHSLGIKKDSTLWAWGRNNSGQLGNGTTTNSITPIKIGNDKWVSIATGFGHSLGIKSDGTLWAWGLNGNAQLGDNSLTSRNVPTKIGTSTNWKTVSAGAYFSVALQKDGTLWSWGNSQYGQLGQNNTATYYVPTKVGVENNWSEITTGYAHCVALKTNGTMWAWGYNEYGQVGDGTYSTRTAPKMIDYKNKWKTISSKYLHNIAVKSDGTLWGWGNNYNGQLGTYFLQQYTRMIQIGTDNDWKIASAGAYHNLALKYDGSVWGAGYNGYSSLGNNSALESSEMTKIYGFFNAKSIFAGINYSIAIQGKGEIIPIEKPIQMSPANKMTNFNTDVKISWFGVPNSNDYQLQVSKNNSFSTFTYNDFTTQTNVTISNLEFNTEYFWRVRVINNQSDTSDWSGIWKFKTKPELPINVLFASGDNSYGQLGDGTKTDRNYQKEVSDFSDWAFLSGGYFHVAGIRSNGTLWTWGYNNSGQLGDNTNTQRLIPVQEVSSDTEWDQVSCSQYHTLALKRDRTLWATGSNSWGLFGDGTTSQSFQFRKIGFDDDWKSVHTIFDQIMALKTDGTLWAWGVNNNSTLGDGTNIQRLTPTKIGISSDWIQVETGYRHTVALKNDGTIWSWGWNNYGQLGNGTTTNTTVPNQIGTDSDWVAISVGENFSVAQKSDGSLWAWGYNQYGQIGDGTTTNRTNPTKIGTSTNWKYFSASFKHVTAIQTNGTLWVWGLNHKGQLGDTTNTYRYTPKQIASSTNWFSVFKGGDYSISTYQYVGNIGYVELLSPEKNSINQNRQVNLQWEETANATSYDIIVDNNSTFSSPIIDINVSQTNYNISGLDFETKYYWKVRGRNLDGNGPWSEVWNFTTKDSISIPNLHLPENSSKFHNTTVELNWYPVTNANGYIVEVSDNNQFNNIILNNYSNDTTESISNLNLETLYYWRVKTVSLPDTSDWSAVWSFKTNPSTTPRLMAWGSNAFGQLGDGTNVEKKVPIQISNDTNWVMVSAGKFSSYAIKKDGSLWGWGSNNYGEVGDGTTNTLRFSPVRIGNEDDWAVVSGGYYFAIAIKKNGTLWAWGNNENGALGDGTATDKNSPVQIGTDSNWVQISAGTQHSIALKSDGTLWAWGLNRYGQLGDSTKINKLSPVQIGTGKDWVQISAGDEFCSAIKKDGSFWNWGSNYYYALGNGKSSDHIYPIQNEYMTNSKATCSSSGKFNLTLDENGYLWTWGYNLYGTLGDETYVDSRYPISVSSKSDWKILSGGSHSSAIDNNNHLYIWGPNMFGQLGDSTRDFNWSTIQRMDEEYYWSYISAGGSHNLAIKGMIHFPAPELVSPANNAQDQELNIVLNWNLTPRTKKYQLQFSNMSNFSSNLIDTMIIGTEFNLMNLSSNKTYYWRVRAFDFVDSSAWSETRNFATITTSTTHNVIFKQGWNLVSTYVYPDAPDSLQYVTVGLNPNLVIMKRADGKIFMPNGLNQIGKWDVKFGYQAYLTKADTLGIIGAPVVPENSPINLNNGWSIIPYLRNSAMSIVTALASITDAGRLIIVKRSDGKIFMPGSINQIGNQLPGEGYQAYLNAKDTLIYPPNAIGRTSSSNHIDDFDSRIIKTDFENTGNNASLILDIDLADNTELAVMNSENKIVGAGRVVDGKTAIVIWGEEEKSNYELRIMNYDAENGKYIEINNLDLTDIITGTKYNKLTYNKDAVLIGKAIIYDLKLSVNPNPFSNSTEVVYTLAEDCEIELSLFNLSGIKVLDIANGKQTKGTHKLTINAENLSSGTYNVILKSCGKSVVEKVVIIK